MGSENDGIDNVSQFALDYPIHGLQLKTKDYFLALRAGHETHAMQTIGIVATFSQEPNRLRFLNSNM